MGIGDGYGQTETGPVTGMRPGEDDPSRDGSMGRPLPGIETRVVDGELQVKPETVPTFFSHYLGEQPFDGEWWATGDQVREDEDGYIWFEGRDDDIIITAGYRVGPFEVESALVSHPAVAEAAAVPAPDEERGSVVRADRGARRPRALGCARSRAPTARQAGHGALQVPANRRVRGGAAEDAERQDSARRAPMRREWASFAGIFIVTNLGLLAVGATLAVLPHYVKDHLDGSDLEVGIVSGAFAFTGIVCRPIAGNLADRRGRKPTVIVGALLAAIAGGLYFLPAGILGLIVARLFLGAGEGTVFTAGSAWNVDMAPEEHRGRMIGPLRPGDLDRPHPRTAHRRAAPARGRLSPRLGLRGRGSPARRRDRLPAAGGLQRRRGCRPRAIHLPRGARPRGDLRPQRRRIRGRLGLHRPQPRRPRDRPWPGGVQCLRRDRGGDAARRGGSARTASARPAAPWARR